VRSRACGAADAPFLLKHLAQAARCLTSVRRSRLVDGVSVGMNPPSAPSFNASLRSASARSRACGAADAPFLLKHLAQAARCLTCLWRLV